MRKFILFLVALAGLSYGATNTVIVNNTVFGSYTNYANGTYTLSNTNTVRFGIGGNPGYKVYPVVNGKAKMGTTYVDIPAVVATNRTYNLSVAAYYIKIEDSTWARQVQKPAGTYYKFGTGIWTQVIWQDPNSSFGGALINGVSTSPTASPMKYFLSAPTTTNTTFKAVKASYNVTLAENADCCMFYPTNGTYSVSDKTFTFRVVPKQNYGVKLIYSGTTNVFSEEKSFTIPISGNTTVTAYRNSTTMTIEGGAFATSPCNTSTVFSNQTQPKSVTVAAVSGCVIDKVYMDGEPIGSAGTYVIPTDKNHTLKVTPVTITVGQNPVGASSPAAGVYTNGVTSFSYSCSVTNTAYSFDGVYFNGEEVVKSNGVYTVKATRPSYLTVKSNKVQPSPSVGGVVASVTFTASGSWQYVNITSPENFDSLSGQKLLPHYGDAVMIQALGGDIDVSQSTNFVSTVYTKTAPYQLTLSPITIPDGNTLVINKPLPGIWFKGSGSVTISTIQR